MFRFTTTPSIGETIVAFAIETRSWFACASATCSVACDAWIVDDCSPGAVTVDPLAATLERALETAA